MIGSVTGYLAFILAVIGFINARKGLPKTLLAGLWSGYLLFGLSATYQMHTHNYYHMPFIPIAALSIAPLGARATYITTNFFYRKWRLSLVLFILFILIAVGFSGQLKSYFSGHKKELKFAGAVIGVNPDFKEFIAGHYDKEISIAKEIGEYVGHNANTVFLSPDFGRILAYYGELSG